MGTKNIIIITGTVAVVGGNNVFTRGGSLPLCLLEKGDEVANLVDSS